MPIFSNAIQHSCTTEPRTLRISCINQALLCHHQFPKRMEDKRVGTGIRINTRWLSTRDGVVCGGVCSLTAAPRSFIGSKTSSLIILFSEDINHGGVSRLLTELARDALMHNVAYAHVICDRGQDIVQRAVVSLVLCTTEKKIRGLF